MKWKSPGRPKHLVAGLHSRGRLPHLKKEGGIYFITFRLAGTLPREVLLRLKADREAIVQNALIARRPLTWKEQLEVFDWYCERVDAYLDASHGECFLRRPEIAGLVSNAIRFFDGQRYRLHAWVVMPNHAHVVVWPHPGRTLSELQHSWKSYTASEANKLLNRVGQQFWQDEGFDHLVRDDEDLTRCCAYTINNPVKAGLCARPEDWPWSSAYQGPQV